jgi:hypothetical protein
VFYLKAHFQSGEFPLRVADRTRRAYDSSVYSLINSSKSCEALAGSGSIPHDGREQKHGRQTFE